MKTMTRTALSVVGVLGALIVVAPPASADTTLPTWTCRGSAAYAELSLLLNSTRVEPVQANGVADFANPDRATCANAATGVQDTAVPSGSPILTVNAASARTVITPEVAAARDQTVLSEGGGVANTTSITLPGLTVTATAVRAQVQAGCNGTTPTFTSSSQIAALTINGTPIAQNLLDDPLDINLGLVRVRLNQDITTSTSLTRRAIHLELLQVGDNQPLTRVVIGEAKAGRNGDVCAAAQTPTCPSGSLPQQGSNPLVCVLTQSAPCPAGSAADPNQGNACVVIGSGTCPSGAIKEPNSGACIVVLQRPCPTGATPDPTTRVCVAVAGSDVNTLVINGRENGRIGGPNGPVPTCGKVTMRFVKGGTNKLTNRLGTRVVTRGRLMSCERRPRPIVSARIDVIHVLPDGRRLRKTGLRSRGDGKLTLILPNDLRTRRIEYGYRPNLDSAKVSSRVTLNLTVRNRAGKVLR